MAPPDGMGLHGEGGVVVDCLLGEQVGRGWGWGAPRIL